MQTNKEKNLIVDLSFAFAVKIIKYCEILEQNHKYFLARQLLKSGTSIGANVREAQNAESTTVFIHKFKIAAKEADETEYWLQLCKSSGYESCDALLENCESIIKVVSKIIASSTEAIIKSPNHQITKLILCNTEIFTTPCRRMSPS